MAMSISAGDDGNPMIDMNTTPLIDVMLVLLIVFIMSLPLMTNNTSIQLPRVDGNASHEVVNLSIDFDGTMLWNGTVVESLEQLESYLRVEAARGEQPELHVRPDKRAKYDTVAKVLALAQRSGMQRIGFAGQEQLMD